ncbi:MAG TPA: alcohol dehydrogenase, partial [Nitrososphaeraceae archaeon]|nr:alcohol dehydrogenase [Nitrososphaeraceae archaeon]
SITKPKAPLEIISKKTPKPIGSQVLVRVQACGVCHSDIHLWEGGYDGPDGEFLKATDRGVRYPLIPGHEIAGEVAEVGEEVASLDLFKKNSKVIVYPWLGEGTCPACREGNENLCDRPRSLGIYNDGGYSEYVLVPSYRYLLNITDDIDTGSFDANTACTLTCSSLTAYGAINNANLRPYDTAVIIGAGGLGLMAIQLAKAITGSTVIAMDLDDNKLKAAKENGADFIVNSKKENAVIAVMEATQKLGADAVIDFVNSSKSTEVDMQLLRKRARLVLVGLYGGALKLNLISLPTRAYKLIGSYTGNIAQLAELVSLTRRGVIKPLVSDKFKLEQATEALSKLKDGKVVGRGVINP